MWNPAFGGILLGSYCLFEVMLLLGRLSVGDGFIIGAQIVITGLLFMFFHELPMMDAAYYEETGKSMLGAIGTIVAAALVAYLVLHALSRIKILIAALIIAEDAFIVWQSVYGYQVFKLAIAMALVLTLVMLWRFSLITQGNSSIFIRYRWLVFFILLEIPVYFIPVSDNPIDWSFVSRIGYRIQDGFETLAENTGYYLSGLGEGSVYQSGYSGLGAAPGSITGNDREEIYVSTKGTMDSLYLTGKIMTDNPEDIAEDIKGRKILDFLYALYSHDVTREEAKCYGKIENLSIELGYLRTRDVIRPENTLRIDYGKQDELDDTGTTFKRTHKKDDIYNTAYLNVDYGSRYLEKIMEKPVNIKWPTYSEMEDYCSILYDYQLSRSISERDYNKWISEKRDNSEYLKIGDMVTPRMRELAEKITGNAESDYEACRAVEAYLRQYKYSTNVDNSYDNYVDAFLFETGKGYCVHFANAMVQLLRISGIPARCVEGYCYAFPNTRTGTFAITGDRAHVWVEAYLEGIGWVPFEPTAVRRTSIDTGWNITMPEAESTIEDSEEAVEKKEDEFYIPEIPEEAEEAIDDEAAGAGEGEIHFIDVRVIAKTMGTILLGLILYVVLMVIAVILIRKLRYRAAPLSGKLEKNMKDILWLMNREFLGPGEMANVLEDYLQYLPEGEMVEGDRLDIKNLRELSGHIFKVYYRQRFAGRDATGIEVRDAEYLRKHLIARYIKNMRPWKKM